MTKRARIIQAVADRLATISRVNGYETDAGETMAIGALSFGPDDDGLRMALLVGDTRAEGSRGLNKKPRDMPLQVALAMRRWRQQSWLEIEAAIGDVKRAIERAEDETFGGLLLGRLVDGEEVTLDTPEGATSMGFALVYRAKYVESWGQP